MRITVLTQLAKGLRSAPETSANIAQELQRVKWFLWHGNVFRARQTVDDLTTDLTTDVGVESGKLAKAVREFGGYLAATSLAVDTVPPASMSAACDMMRRSLRLPMMTPTHGAGADPVAVDFLEAMRGRARVGEERRRET